MAKSHVIITKAGGLTVTESLAMGLPMIFFFLLPGQEVQNAEFICAHNAGIIAKSDHDIAQHIERLKNSPQELLTLKMNSLSLARPAACSDILKLI